MNSSDTFDRLLSVAERERARTMPRRTDVTEEFRAVDEAVVLTPVEEEKFDRQDASLFALIELILKDRPRLHRLIRSRPHQTLLVGRLLAISLASFMLFGLTMSLVLTVSGAWPTLRPVSEWLKDPSKLLATFNTLEPGASRVAVWTSGNAFKLTAAYALGLVAASGVCLPSLYFYCLLAGVRMRMVDVVLHAVKAKADAAMALMGILPIYVAAAMGVVIFGADEALLKSVLIVGLLLPFLAGFWGTASVYDGFAQACKTMPAGFAERRACFLRRLVLSWSGIYSAVMPVMIYTLWEVSMRF